MGVEDLELEGGVAVDLGVLVGGCLDGMDDVRLGLWPRQGFCGR